MKDCGVQLDQSAIFPERGAAAGVDPHFLSDDREKVIPGDISKVPRGDLGAHVVAIERRGGKLPPLSNQSHIGDRGNCVPTEVQIGEPREIGVRDRHLHHHLAGQLKKLGRGARDFDDEGKDVKCSFD